MIKKIKLTVFLVLGLTLTSCLEILEDIKINENGTGIYKLNLNLSQSKSQIDKILTQDSIQGKPIPNKDKITKEFNKLIELLKNQSGISQVVTELDLSNFILKISFNFDKIESLNTAVNSIIKSQDSKAPLNPVVYTYDSGIFSRVLNADLMSQALRDKEKVAAFMTNFDQAKVTSITRFEKNIKQSNHSEAKISSNFKNCFEQVTINQLLTNKNLHKHTIILQ